MKLSLLCPNFFFYIFFLNLNIENEEEERKNKREEQEEKKKEQGKDWLSGYATRRSHVCGENGAIGANCCSTPGAVVWSTSAGCTRREVRRWGVSDGGWGEMVSRASSRLILSGY